MSQLEDEARRHYLLSGHTSYELLAFARDMECRAEEYRRHPSGIATWDYLEFDKVIDALIDLRHSVDVTVATLSAIKRSYTLEEPYGVTTGADGNELCTYKPPIRDGEYEFDIATADKNRGVAINTLCRLKKAWDEARKPWHGRHLDTSK